MSPKALSNTSAPLMASSRPTYSSDSSSGGIPSLSRASMTIQRSKPLSINPDRRNGDPPGVSPQHRHQRIRLKRRPRHNPVGVPGDLPLRLMPLRRLSAAPESLLLHRARWCEKSSHAARQVDVTPPRPARPDNPVVRVNHVTIIAQRRRDLFCSLVTVPQKPVGPGLKRR